MKRSTQLFAILLSSFLLAVFSVSMVLADAAQPKGVFETADDPADTPDGEGFVGTVTAIDAEAGTVEIEVLQEDGESVFYTVVMPADFDFESIALGGALEVTGTVDEDGVITLAETEAEDDELDGGYYCATADATHPAAEKLTEEYDVEYEQVMTWFCKETATEDDTGDDDTQNNANTGFGEIKLALETAEIVGGDADELLAQRDEGLGWGQIWQELGYTGKPKGEAPDGDGAANEDADDAGNGNGNANAANEDHGPPDHANNDKEKDNNGHGNDKGKGKDK